MVRYFIHHFISLCFPEDSILFTKMVRSCRRYKIETGESGNSTTTMYSRLYLPCSPSRPVKAGLRKSPQLNIIVHYLTHRMTPCQDRRGFGTRETLKELIRGFSATQGNENLVKPLVFIRPCHAQSKRLAPTDTSRILSNRLL